MNCLLAAAPATDTPIGKAIALHRAFAASRRQASGSVQIRPSPMRCHAILRISRTLAALPAALIEFWNRYRHLPVAPPLNALRRDTFPP